MGVSPQKRRSKFNNLQVSIFFFPVGTDFLLSRTHICIFFDRVCMCVYVSIYMCVQVCLT